MTVFLGCGFAAKYREGGGNFSVPLQWMLGLRRLKLDKGWPVGKYRFELCGGTELVQTLRFTISKGEVSHPIINVANL